MHKKRILVSLILFSLIITLSFASAFSFFDLFKTTGKAATTSTSLADSDGGIHPYKKGVLVYGKKRLVDKL